VTSIATCDVSAVQRSRIASGRPFTRSGRAWRTALVINSLTTSKLSSMMRAGTSLAARSSRSKCRAAGTLLGALGNSTAR
jgi:hypothetical protein